MSNNRNTREELEPSAQWRMRKLTALLELAEGDTSPQREEHNDTVELLQDVAQELENQQQLDQQQQDLELPTDNDRHSDEEGSCSTSSIIALTLPGSPPLASPPHMESDDEDMAGTKIGIPKFTGQETDVSDKARDWLTGLQTYFTEKSIGAAEWERRCGLIRWSLVSDSIPDGQDSTSASSWFKGIMEDDVPGGRVFTSFVDFRGKFEKRWITGTPLEEASNIIRCLTQNQKETIHEYAERIMREDGRLMRLGMSMMTVEAADSQGWRQAFEWLNIIVLMGGLRDKFLNHVKRAVTQLPAADRIWEQIKETASIQQDHKSNRRTQSNSFSKGTVNYTGQRGRSSSPGPRGMGGGGGGGSGAGGGGGKKMQHWWEKPSMRPSWVGQRHMTQDACMVCNYTGHKAGQCKAPAKNKQNWGPLMLLQDVIVDYNDPVTRRRLAHEFWMVLMLVKFHSRVDRRIKDEFLDELGGQAYDLLQLWEDRILTNGFRIRLWDGDAPPPPEEVAAARETAEEPKEPFSPETTAALLQPRED